MDPIIHIPLTAIAMDALPRDRSTLDAAALAELQASVSRDGLRQPIEVWQLTTPSDGHDYGLISGLRRLTVHHNLNRLRPTAFTTIPAFLRSPASVADAMAAMVAENEIRSDLSAHSTEGGQSFHGNAGSRSTGSRAAGLTDGFMESGLG